MELSGVPSNTDSRLPPKSPSRISRPGFIGGKPVTALSSSAYELRMPSKLERANSAQSLNTQVIPAKVADVSAQNLNAPPVIPPKVMDSEPQGFATSANQTDNSRDAVEIRRSRSASLVDGHHRPPSSLLRQTLAAKMADVRKIPHKGAVGPHAHILNIDLAEMSVEKTATLILQTLGFEKGLLGLFEKKEKNLIKGQAFYALRQSIGAFSKNRDKIAQAIPLVENEIKGCIAHRMENQPKDTVAEELEQIEKDITNLWVNHVAGEFASLYLSSGIRAATHTHPTPISLNTDLSKLGSEGVKELLLPVFGFEEARTHLEKGRALVALRNSIQAFPTNLNSIVSALPLVEKSVSDRVAQHLKSGFAHSPLFQRRIEDQMAERCQAHFFEELASLDTDEKTRKILILPGVVGSRNVIELAKQLFRIYERQPKKLLDAIRRYHHFDLKGEKENTILRENSLVVRLGFEYITKVCAEELNRIFALAEKFSIDKKDYITFFHELYAMTLSQEFRTLLCIRREVAQEHFPKLTNMLVGKMLFFEILCPYLRRPHQPKSFAAFVEILKQMEDIADCEDLTTHYLCGAINIHVLKKTVEEYKAFLIRNTTV